MKKFILICLLFFNCQPKLELDSEIILKGVDIYTQNGKPPTCEYTIDTNNAWFYGELKIFCNEDNYSHLLGKKIKIQLVEDTQ